MSCKYFRYYDPVNQECLHDQIGFQNAFTLVAIIVVPLTVPFFTASGFGISAFQNIVLTFLFKYGRKSAVAMTQPIQAGINLSAIITNLLKKTTDNKRLVDVGLAALMIPNMITGIVAGLHWKEYVPSLLGTFLIVAQLILLVLQSLKKKKQLQEIQNIPNVDQIVPNDDFIICPDGVMIDYEDLFKKLKQSKIRVQAEKVLPQDLLELDITIDEHKIRVKDYLQENYQVAQEVHEKIHGQHIPKSKLFAIGVSIALNIWILTERGQGTTCQTVYWLNYPYQILMNFVLTLVITFFIKHQYNPVFIVKVSLLALICGFFLGIIGMGAQLLLIMGLSKLKDINKSSAEINATLPLIMVSVYSTSSIITISNGLQFDLRGSFIMFGLAFLGQFFLNPKYKPYFPPKKMISYNIIFTLLCIGVYLFTQIPKIATTPFIYQITPHPPRCNEL